ncbi:unnamed protein product [Auanema sp. JU1783]|nr:unnamed protein product [Auanema sp. JU1783]
MSAFLNEILGRAEKLSSVNYQEDINHAVVNASDGRQHTAKKNVPLFTGTSSDVDLASIFRASENLWSKANSNSTKKDFLFGDKGVVFGVTAPELSSTFCERAVEEEDEDVQADVQRVRVEAERAFFNHVLLSKPQTTLSATSNLQKPNQTLGNDFRMPNSTSSSRRELLFGDKIRKYIRSGKRKDISELLCSVNDDPATDTILVDIWHEAAAMMTKKLSDNRDENSTSRFFVENACHFLHKQYIQHMTDKVERNLELAQRGGIPGTKGLVEAFLKIAADDPNAEDGVINGLPVWEVTYHCFRAGELSAASDALNQLNNCPQSACLVQSLHHLDKYNKLDSELKKKVKVEWRHNMNNIRDKYKRALYAAILGTESPLADSLENWLWFQLIPLHIDPHMTTTLFVEVQKTISVDYGEDYFMRSGEFHYYFTVLWLSSQFEKAIQLLTNNNMILEAVHLAILGNEFGYIRCCADSSAPLVVSDPAQPTVCFLNIPRLVVTYTKEFELTDPTRAMDYFFMVKGFKTPSGADVFEKSVSRSVYLCNSRDEIDSIVGNFDKSGKRCRGLIDEYVEDASPIIESIAFDTETSGSTLEALRLYLLASCPGRAVNLLSSEISTALRCERNDLQNLKEVAVEYWPLLGRAQASDYSELAILVDLIKIFEACATNKTEEAFRWSQELRLLPVEAGGVAVAGDEFHLVPQRVREVIPDYCLAMMKCMVNALHEKHNPKYLKQVKAIVLYAATINFKFPQHISSQLLKLQAAVNL